MASEITLYKFAKKFDIFKIMKTLDKNISYDKKVFKLFEIEDPYTLSIAWN